MGIGESIQTAKIWLRAHTILLLNPYKGERQVQYLEERIVELDDGTFSSQAAPGLSFTFDPSEEIPLVDPTTDLPIPGATMTQAQIMVGIHSLYFKKAQDRG